MTRKVLVVEDEIFVAAEIESVAIELGLIPVGIAADSRRALELAEKAELALIDLNLMDGPTGGPLGAMLAQKGVTVLFMTANPSQLGEGVPGAIGVLPKPVDDTDLRQAVTYAVAHHEKRPYTPPKRLKLFRPQAN